MRARVAKKIYRREFKYFSIASSQGDSRFTRYMLRAWLKDIKIDNSPQEGIHIKCVTCGNKREYVCHKPITKQLGCEVCDARLAV